MSNEPLPVPSKKAGNKYFFSKNQELTSTYHDAGDNLILLNDGYILKIDETGRLQFIIEETGTVMDTFALRAYETVRPGDDILLRFELVDYDVPVLDTRDGDFLAVYDKMMMWRVHLFIDETHDADGTASGDLDWNNVNRWTYAEGNEGNSWDRDWFDHDSDGIVDEAGPYNGGQCEIRPWTSIYTYYTAYIPWANARGYPLEVHNSVPYSIGCDDTPYFYNEHMDSQKDSLFAYYADSNNTQIPPNPPPGDHRDWSSTDTNTIAPEQEWGNYLGDPPIDNSITECTALAGIIIPGTNPPQTKTYYPYRPGFSSYVKLDGNADTDYTQANTKFSAGVECQGIISRAAGYAGNTYVIDSELDTVSATWTTVTGAGMNIFNWPNLGWEIHDIDDDQTSFVVPGDVIYVDGHVGIVNKVEYDNERIAIAENVYIIESYGRSMSVYNQRTWSHFRAENNITFCYILRLRT